MIIIIFYGFSVCVIISRPIYKLSHEIVPEKYNYTSSGWEGREKQALSEQTKNSGLPYPKSNIDILIDLLCLDFPFLPLHPVD